MSANTRDDLGDDFETTQPHIEDPEKRRERLSELEEKIRDEGELSDAEMREYFRERVYGLHKIVRSASDVPFEDIAGFHWTMYQRIQERVDEERGRR